MEAGITGNRRQGNDLGEHFSYFDRSAVLGHAQVADRITEMKRSVGQKRFRFQALKWSPEMSRCGPGAEKLQSECGRTAGSNHTEAGVAAGDNGDICWRSSD